MDRETYRWNIWHQWVTSLTFHDVIYNIVNFGPYYPLNNYLTIRISTLLRITYCIPCLFKVDIKLKGSFCCQVYIQAIYYIYECVTLCARTYFIHSYTTIILNIKLITVSFWANTERMFQVKLSRKLFLVFIEDEILR